MTSEAAAQSAHGSLAAPLDLAADDFALFELAPQFAQQRNVIDARWRALQAQVHPDRFAADGAAAQHLAMQWATRVNEAHRRLKSPIERAAYLCALNGHDVHSAPQPPMPLAFLMQQMALRESLDEARTPAHLEALADDVETQRTTLLDALCASIDERADWPTAATQVRSLMFFNRLADDIDQRLDAAS